MVIIYLILAVAVVVIDQIIKYFVVQNLQPIGRVEAIPNLLDLVYVENTGVAFGMFSSLRWLFVVVTSIVIVAFVVLLFKIGRDSKLFSVSAALIIGGGIGNLIDRVFLGYVVDYLQLSFFSPVCNFADYCITAGTVLLIIYLVFYSDLSNDKKLKRKLKMNKTNFVCEAENVGERIDSYLSKACESFSRSAITKNIEKGLVTVNGKVVNKSYKLNVNDSIEMTIEAPTRLDVIPQDIPLDIVYEDDDLLVVNKPKGMVVHPAAGNYTDTLVNALMYHCKDSLSGINGVLRPGIVHRIDKNTSGLLIVAKNDKAHNHLAAQIKEHSFTREYVTVVYGNIKDDTGTVNAPIGRHPVDRKKMCVINKNSKEAITHYVVLERFNGFTMLKCKLETGRTHQIRVHMAYIGHPVAGDDVYGPKKVIKTLNGQCLHAQKIGFIHPTTEEYIEFSSEVPQVFSDFLHKLQKNY